MTSWSAVLGEKSANQALDGAVCRSRRRCWRQCFRAEYGRPNRMAVMSITRDEVAHLARLSRLALTDAELDHFAGQLDQIIGAVARVQEVAGEGIPPMTHAVPVVNVFRDDVDVT